MDLGEYEAFKNLTEHHVDSLKFDSKAKNVKEATLLIGVIQSLQRYIGYKTHQEKNDPHK